MRERVNDGQFRSSLTPCHRFVQISVYRPSKVRNISFPLFVTRTNRSTYFARGHKVFFFPSRFGENRRIQCGKESVQPRIIPLLVRVFPFQTVFEIHLLTIAVCPKMYLKVLSSIMQIGGVSVPSGRHEIYLSSPENNYDRKRVNGVKFFRSYERSKSIENRLANENRFFFLFFSLSLCIRKDIGRLKWNDDSSSRNRYVINEKNAREYNIIYYRY